MSLDGGGMVTAIRDMFQMTTVYCICVFLSMLKTLDVNEYPACSHGLQLQEK